MFQDGRKSFWKRAAALSSNSRALTAYNVRRAGSSSRLRSGRRSEVRHEPAPDSVRNFFVHFEGFSPLGGGNGAPRISGTDDFSAWGWSPFSYLDAAGRPLFYVQRGLSYQSIGRTVENRVAFVRDVSGVVGANGRYAAASSNPILRRAALRSPEKRTG